MSIQRKFLIVPFVIFSNIAFADQFICQAVLTSNGQVIKRFTESDLSSMQNACRESLRECHKEKSLLERQGSIIEGECNVQSSPQAPDIVIGQPGTFPGTSISTPPHILSRISQIEVMLRSNSWRIREAALVELRAFPYPKSIELAILSINDNDYDVRKACESTLGHLLTHTELDKYQQEIMEIMIGLSHSQSWKIRFNAAKIIGMLNSSIGITQLITMLGDNDSDVLRVVQNGIQVKIQMHDLAIVARNERFALNELLLGHQWKIRVAALETIAKAYVFDLLPEVILRSADNDFDVKNKAVSSVGILVSHPRFIASIGMQINEIGTLTVHSSYHVRKLAVFVLGESRNHLARSYILRALNDSDIDVRREAEIALRKL